MTNFHQAQHNHQPNQSAPKRRPLGLSFIALIGLALLAVPRVALHDLDIIAERTPLNALFVFIPAII